MHDLRRVRLVDGLKLLAERLLLGLEVDLGNGPAGRHGLAVVAHELVGELDRAGEEYELENEEGEGLAREPAVTLVGGESASREGQQGGEQQRRSEAVHLADQIAAATGRTRRQLRDLVDEERATVADHSGDGHDDHRDKRGDPGEGRAPLQDLD